MNSEILKNDKIKKTHQLFSELTPLVDASLKTQLKNKSFYSKKIFLHLRMNNTQARKENIHICRILKLQTIKHSSKNRVF